MDAHCNAVICVYGHGPTKNPFYEEARTVRQAPAGALLILSAPVSRGQRLLLLNGPGRHPLEAQIVRTRTLGAQMFEVEVAFPSPHPEFWQPFRSSGREGKRRRRGTRRRKMEPRSAASRA